VLVAVYMLLRQLQRDEHKVENEYSRTVKYDGNVTAQAYLKEVFEPDDVTWRGFSSIPASGMKLREEYEAFDAGKKYEEILGGIDASTFGEARGCHCGEVLRGVYEPSQCPLFARVCTPQTPVGPCMVSLEGSCNIEYRYKRRR